LSKPSFLLKFPFSQKLNVTIPDSENWTFFKTHEIEYPPSPICGEKPQFELNVTSFQFRQNALAQWWPILSATTLPRHFGGDSKCLKFEKLVSYEIS